MFTTRQQPQIPNNHIPDGTNHYPQKSPRSKLSFFKTVQGKLTLWYVGSLSIFVVLFGLLMYAAIHHTLYTNADSVLQAHAIFAHNVFTNDIKTRESLSLDDALADAQTYAPDANEAYILNYQGFVVSNDTVTNTRAPYISWDSWASTLLTQSRNGRNILNQSVIPVSSGTHKYGAILIPFVISRATTDKTPLVVRKGAIELVTHYDSANSSLDNLLFTLVIGAICIIAGACIIGISITSRALSPLKRMSRTAKVIASGDLSQRVRLPLGYDEIGEMANAFDEMIERIEVAFASQQRSEQKMRQFIADASHELRTPLTSMRGYTDVLLRGAKDDPETVTHVLHSMQREAERMSRLVNDLLTLARLDTGRNLEKQAIDLVQMAHDVVEQIQVVAEDRKVLLESGYIDRLYVQGDNDRVKQVLLILMDNAVKYAKNQSGEESWIKFGLKQLNGRAIITISDNGPGIPPEDVPHIFERFYRGERSRSRENEKNTEGSGLGLSIAQGLIQAHGGDINVTSAVNQGTTFTISLPTIHPSE